MLHLSKFDPFFRIVSFRKIISDVVTFLLIAFQFRKLELIFPFGSTLFRKQKDFIFVYLFGMGPMGLSFFRGVSFSHMGASSLGTLFGF